MQTSYQFQSQCSTTSSDSEEDEEEFFREVKNCINAELLPALKRHLSEKKGKEQFLNWLFKVADWKHDGRITMEELDLILRAVQQDGIDLHDLLFDNDEQSKTMSLAQHVMSEYDFSHEGFLTKDEFMTLGEIILNHYELSQQQQQHGRIGVWDLTHILGEGSYGTVMCAVNSETGERRAIKRIKRGTVSDMSRLDIEIQAMMMLRHPNVVHLEDIIETEENIFLVMELCGGGSLHENLTDKPLDEDLARYYFNRLIDGLSYCHSQGVCHRDLRLENLLLADDGSLKITDFGQARIFKKGWDLFSTQLVGSLHHLSPEQISGHCYSGEKVDVWSAGVILYCFLTANFPFASVDVTEMFDCIRNVRYELPDILSSEAKDLIQHILQVDPNNRLTLQAIKNHPWTRGNQKQPQLMQYALDLEYKSVTSWLEAKGWETVEKILDMFEIYYLLNDAHSDLSTKTIRNLKCLYPPADLKFSVSLMAPDGEHGKIIMIQFNLREGETKQFRKLVHRIHKAFRQKFRCLQNELPSLAIPVPNNDSPASVIVEN